MSSDKIFMNHALELAQLSGALGEVPVGCVVVVNNKIIAEGYNRKEMRHSCIEHAEIMALADACERLGRWRLSDATVYATLEPCLMCAGALLHARISRLVFGAHDPKFGAMGSLFSLHNDTRLNHSFVCLGGVEAEASAALLKAFFAEQRQKKRLHI